MNKFAKRISKSTKNQSICLVVGTAFGNLEELSDIFQTVFLHTDDRGTSFKKKNVVFLETIDNHTDIPLISTVFVDIEYINRLASLKHMMTKYSPTIMIGSGEFIDKMWNRFLVDHRYQIVELFKEYQIWKIKK